MKAQIGKLYRLSNATVRRVIGLMSGTSLDGLDIAVCLIEGSGMTTQVQIEKFITLPYSEDFKLKLRKIFANPKAELEEVTLMNAWIAREHARLILQALSTWEIKTSDICLLASHGQTIYHAPKKQHLKYDFPNATMQIGDGDHLAFLTNIITISDFRQKHIAAGGEGAPLAVYGDYILFSKKGENRVLLNIGGISNFTFLSGDLDSRKVFSTDIGPGNTLMNQFVNKYFPGMDFDEDAKIAKSGKLSIKLLNQLLSNDFFELPFPRTTGPEVFNLEFLFKAQELSNTNHLKLEDVLCTLCHFTAHGIANALKKVIDKMNSNTSIEETDLTTFVVYASGGGIHNPLLMEVLSENLPQIKIKDFNTLGILPDAKEAVLFAVLANECIAGENLLFENNPSVPSVSMGKISLPS